MLHRLSFDVAAAAVGTVPDPEDACVLGVGRTAIGLVVLTLTLALAACGNDVSSSSPPDGATSSAARPSAGDRTAATDLSAIACATNDPDDVGDLTGAWSGDDTGVYYIRQVGDCVWWFGTEIDDIEPGLTGQPGFANVASGRVDGNQIDVEWADLPVGNILGGGGLTLVYDEETDQLLITEQRGGWQPFGASTFTRIDPDASPDASPSEAESS
jgi:hypothetical protein